MNFVEGLRMSAQSTGSIACMGLDPVHGMVPPKYPNFRYRTRAFFEEVFAEMKDQKVFPGAFKPNEGYYAKHDQPLMGRFQGSTCLGEVINMIRAEFPNIPLILDNKRGDIATSSKNYAEEGFDAWGADAVTVHGYMGSDSIGPFAEYCDQGKGVYILDRTSNPGGADFQNRSVVNNNLRPLPHNKPLYEVVAYKIAEWAQEHPGVGAVVGATNPKELSDIAKIFAPHNIPILIPGVGSQGGSAEEVVSRLQDAGYDLSLARISSSSGITHPWKKNKELYETLEKGDWKDAAKVSVAELYNLNEAIGHIGR